MRLHATRRAAIAQGRGLGNPLWDLAGVPPSLDQRFAESKSLIDAVSGQNLITFTRASDGAVVNSAGQIEIVAANVPRFDHNPVTLESLGLLVEEQRTNSIRNNTMVGAVAGTPGTLPTNWSISGSGLGTLTQQVVNTGTVNGITYVDVRFSGTASNGDFALAQEPTAEIVAANTQNWAASVWLAVVGGSTANIASLAMNIVERTSAGTFVAQQSSANLLGSLGSSLNRFTAVFTLAGGATVARIQPRFLNFSYLSGAAIDITLRIGMPQLEQGAFVTSVIRTTGTAATRTASLADVINQAIANNIRTLFLEFRSPASGTRGVVSLNDNTANERAAVITSGTDPRLVVHDGGVEQANINGGTVTANQRTRIAVRINANDFAISINGGTVVTDTSGTLPTVDRLMLGRTQAGEYLNAPLARVTGWTQLVPDSTLQELSR
jgi:hypothetical protein